MSIKKLSTVLIALMFSSVVYADLEPWEDYDISEAVWSVSTIKVDSNMGDAYLEGLQKTWAASMETSKKLGQVEDYRIFRSQLPESGDFNLMLVVKFKNSEMMAPNKERYDAFMKEVGKAESDSRTEHAQKNYPAMRTITGNYNLREITFK